MARPNGRNNNNSEGMARPNGRNNDNFEGMARPNGQNNIKPTTQEPNPKSLLLP